MVFIVCSNPDDPEETIKDPAIGPEPVLRNLAVEFDSAFTLEDVDKIIHKFFEFGYEVRDQYGDLKALPHFTYALERSIEVISPMEGIIDAVHLQDELTQDYAIWLKPKGDTTLWLVELDHVTKVAVTAGDEVDVGDLLGYPGGGGIRGILELMVNSPEAHVCPFEVFDPEAALEIQGRLTKFLAAWDSAKWALPEDNSYHPNHPSGWYVPYDSLAMVVPGCRSWEINYPEY